MNDQQSMRPVSYDEYLDYVKHNHSITIGRTTISLEPLKIKRLVPVDEELTDISTTVWSFPKRGAWATHRGNYRGNWPPQMARALISMYTEPGDTVLDPMIGSGTTCIEAKLLGRNCIGVDINYEAVILTLHRLYWLEKALEDEKLIRQLEDHPEHLAGATIEDIRRARIQIYHGDARNLDKIKKESIDLVATHPPYYNIIRYGREKKIPGDLSMARSLEEYMSSMKKILGEAYRALKPGKHLGILVGDTRNRKHYVPITTHVLEILLSTGFILREEVVKIQHKMKTTRELWSRMRNRGFLLIYHEKLFIARKPLDPSEYKKYVNSMLPGWIMIDL